MNRPIRWFTGNHVAANLLMLLIVVGGLMATTTIKREFFPEIRPDLITVTVVYPGAAPEVRVTWIAERGGRSTTTDWTDMTVGYLWLEPPDLTEAPAEDES